MQETSRIFNSTEDVPCVWMRAGILSYQLCNREYDCYDCPLDHALREHFSRESLHHATLGKPVLQHESVSLRDDCMYSHQHCWIQRRNDGTVRVGIEPRLARVLLIPKSIVLPSKGQAQKKHQASVWIVLEQGTFPLVSPLDGLIINRNSDVSENPSQALSHPFDEGWLYEMTCTTDDSNNLMNHAEAKLQYDHDMQQFNELVVSELKSGLQSGPTLADGGVMLQHVADMLGQKKYMKILRAVFG
ncbi:MAG: glycine cleavage system protein H [Ignavibacteriales bacterium]|nr:glycine cleavage system protein H [Ignavibacteriales bacterium]